MKRWYDSSASLADDAGLRAARAAGVAGWMGYLATRAGTGLWAPWPKSNFDRIKAAGLLTGAYVSGNDDPVALRQLATSWGIDLLILDVEPAIRGDGSWVPGFLSACHSGLYGAPSVHRGRTAACHVVANYPGGIDQLATWPPWLIRPSGPVGWQQHGSTSAYGATVDISWFDDAIGAQGEVMTDEQWRYLQAMNIKLDGLGQGLQSLMHALGDNINAALVGPISDATASRLKAQLDAITAQVAAIPGGGGTAPAPTTVTSTITSVLK